MFRKDCAYILIGIAFVLSSCAGSNVHSIKLYQAVIFDQMSSSGHESPYLQNLIIDEVNKFIYYGNNVKMPLLDCQTEGWYCLSDGNIEFAIPRKWNEIQSSWIYRNVKYSVIENPSSKSAIHFILADSQLSPGSSPKVYMYSKSNGLTGIVMNLSGIDDELITAVYQLVKK